MKDIGYNLLKFWIRSGLYLYFARIKVSGLEHVPKDKPVLFLPNHQSALVDVLLLAVDCNRKPYFLTRSDVFKKPWLKRFFSYLQMLPIYRIRDGREALRNNDGVFAVCAGLLERGEAILMFPEANHNLKRRVRPLSKGFTRILFGALEKNPDIDVRLVPVGLNYRDAENFPDSVAINFGENIPLRNLYDGGNLQMSTNRVKEAVAESLKVLTTHIENEDAYDGIVRQLDAIGADYLNPSQVNESIRQLEMAKALPGIRSVPNGYKNILRFLFIVLNLPLVLPWRLLVKPRVWEPEFMATLRFGYALLAAPIYYLLFFTVFALIHGPLGALYVTSGLVIFNWGYVKWC